MLHRLNAVLLFVLMLAALSLQAQKTAYRIAVKIPGMSDTTCYLGRYYGDKQYVVDTARSDATGLVVFEGKKMLEGGLYLFVFPDRRYFEFILDRDRNITFETQWDDPITHMKVKNSPDNELFYAYLRQAISLQQQSARLQEQLQQAKSAADSAAIRDQLRDLERQIVTYRDNYINQHPQTFLAKVFLAMKDPVIPEPWPVLANGRPDSTFPYRYYKAHYWDQVDLTDNRLLRTPVFAYRLKKYFDELVPKIPDSINVAADQLIARARSDSEMYRYLVWWITYTYETSKIMGMDAVFVHMTEKYYMNGSAWWVDSTTLAKMIDRARRIAPNLIGNTAPELALRDTSGRLQVLSKIPARYTILVFYDPDCGHCQQEVPKIKEAYQRWKDKGVAVFAVDIEVDTEKWKKFIRQHQLDWINVSDPYHQSNFRQLYDVYSTPVIYILDEQKKIRAKRIAADQIDEVLQHLSGIKEKS
ncbi:MAG: DUF5106 domain-containing protein [Chitinophagales bacterium]|nr:DUF5106 domain-containing protein [Chitinophagales bacterium]MDW8393068.1 DUF5106 domain-containing protein [Chitinophagales bacterium]